MEEEEKEKKPEKKLIEGTVAYHQFHIDRIKANKVKAAKAGVAKRDKLKKETIKEGYGKTNKEKRKDPPTRYRSRVEFSFLKYLRVVMKWAVENHPDLNKGQIELLLFLYDCGAFTRVEFDDYHRLVSLFSIKTLKHFEDKGYVKLWRPKDKKTGNKELYTLTLKGKLLANKMHRYCAGVEPIPTGDINLMGRKDAPRINNYYLDVIKRMMNRDLTKDENEESPD